MRRQSPSDTVRAARHCPGRHAGAARLVAPPRRRGRPGPAGRTAPMQVFRVCAPLRAPGRVRPRCDGDRWSKLSSPLSAAGPGPGLRVTVSLLRRTAASREFMPAPGVGRQSSRLGPALSNWQQPRRQQRVYSDAAPLVYCLTAASARRRSGPFRVAARMERSSIYNPCGPQRQRTTRSISR